MGSKMSDKTFKIVGNDMSDGYHTFDELYEHRCLLYLNLCLLHPEKCVFKMDYGAWFCLYFETDIGQISYHIPHKYIDLVVGKIRQDDNHKWDGHDSETVITRLELLASKNPYLFKLDKP